MSRRNHRINYSRGSVPVAGTERPGFIGGGILVDHALMFTAWCSCGEFSYFGSDEDCRRFAVRRHRERAELTVGDGVVYRGSVAREHGERFLVSAVGADGRLTLVDDYLGDTKLSNVRVDSVDPTGEPRIDMCDGCGHRSDETIPNLGGCCMAYGCSCWLHACAAVA